MTEWNALDMTATTMKGDLRDVLLGMLRDEQTRIPWHLRPEHEQRRTVQKIEDALEPIVRRATVLIASNARPYVYGQLTEVKLDEKMSCKIELKDGDSEVTNIRLMRRQQLLVLSADHKGFLGQKGPVEITKAQGELWQQQRQAEADANETAAQAAEGGGDGQGQPTFPPQPAGEAASRSPAPNHVGAEMGLPAIGDDNPEPPPALVEPPEGSDGLQRQAYTKGAQACLAAAQRGPLPTEPATEYRVGTRSYHAWHAGWRDQANLMGLNQPAEEQAGE